MITLFLAYELFFVKIKTKIEMILRTKHYKSTNKEISYAY